MERLLIIDGNSLVNRAFYALPLLSNQDGEYSNAVYGFCNILIKFITEQKPDYICVAFDHSRQTFRTEMYAQYKGTRKQMPEELRSQMPILKNLLNKMNIKIYEVDNIEADDIIGTVVKNSAVKNIILSGDRDVLQLIDKNTEVWLTKKGITDVQVVTLENIKDLYGVEPSQIIDLKSLMGDSSDNIPGVTGIGEITAKNLILKYNSLQGVYNNIEEIKGKINEKLTSDKDMAFLSYQLATIKTDCNINVNIDDYSYDFPFNNDVKEIFEKYQFKSLLKRNELFITKDINKLETEIVINKIELKSIDQLTMILQTEKIDYVSFNFVNQIEFCFNNNTLYYLPKQSDLFNFSSLNIVNIIDILKPVFYNDKINKNTFDLKSHMHINDVFCNLKGDIFDVSIAQYLVNAGEKNGTKIHTQDYNSFKEMLLKEIKELDLEFVYNNIEIPLVNVLYEMEKNGFFIDKNELDFLLTKYTSELDIISKQIYSCSNTEFNINSPKQVSNILFEVLGLSDFNNKKHSTGIEYLNMLKSEHEIVPLLIRYRKIQKLYSTYLEPYSKLVKEKGECIHTIFNQTLTATGRLSSSEPNLQNIPVREEEGKYLRKMFVSRFNDGQIISADYNQIELRLLAAFSKDENLQLAYKNNKDIHLATAAQIFDKNLEDVTPNERSSAKAVNFGIIYGISAYGLANQIGETPKKAKYFIDKYLNTYPKVKKYMNDNVRFATLNNYIKTYCGRIRRIPELSSANKNIIQFGERIAMNMPLQGSASDIIKLAMINVNNEIKKLNLKSKLILQIHDELIVDAPKDELEIVKQILKNTMENVVKLEVPLTVNISSGKTWFDAK